MSYELRADETLGDGICRIVCRQIEDAICASKTKQNGKGSPVHETRKHLKKARAALRLVRGEVERDLWKKEDRCLGKVAQLISQVRDAEVRLQTVRQLREFARGKKEGFQKTEEFLAFELDSFLAAFSEWPEEAEERSANVSARCTTWPLSPNGFPRSARPLALESGFSMRSSIQEGRSSSARRSRLASAFTRSDHENSPGGFPVIFRNGRERKHAVHRRADECWPR